MDSYGKTFPFQRSETLPLLITLHWVADGWQMYLFSRQLAVANNTIDVPPKLREKMSPQDYDSVRRQSQNTSAATMMSVGIHLLIKTLKLLLGYHVFIWKLTMHQTETQFWRSVLYGVYDVLFSKLTVLPFSTLAVLVARNSSEVSIQTHLTDTLVQIIGTTVTAAASIACLIMTIDYFGSNILLYFAPIANVCGLIFMTVYIQYVVPRHYYPVENEETLKVLIPRLTNVVGYPSNKVYVDPNENAPPNAYFIGVLGANMIIISRSLISILDPEHLTAVVAHELGHWSKDHNVIILLLSAVEISTLSICMAYSYDSQIIMDIFGFYEDKPEPIITLYLWLAYISPLIAGLLSGIKSVIGRFGEFYADDFASALGLGLNLKTALLTLASKSKAYPIFDPLFSAWYLGHPTILERIERIESH